MLLWPLLPGFSFKLEGAKAKSFVIFLFLADSFKIPSLFKLCHLLIL